MKPPPKFMSYEHSVKLFGLLVQVLRLQGQVIIGEGLSAAESERLTALESELQRLYPDG